jgi:hypothetical protein
MKIRRHIECGVLKESSQCCLRNLFMKSFANINQREVEKNVRRKMNL